MPFHIASVPMKNAPPPFFLSVFWCDLPQAVPFSLETPPTSAQIDQGRRRADILSARHEFGKYILLMLSVALILYAVVLAVQGSFVGMCLAGLGSLGVFIVACRYRRANEAGVEDFETIGPAESLDISEIRTLNEGAGRYITAVSLQGRPLVAKEIQLLNASLQTEA